MSESITAEELDRRRRARSSTPEEDRPKCEHCGSVALSPRTQKYDDQRHASTDAPYRCDQCGRFVEGTGGAQS